MDGRKKRHGSQMTKGGGRANRSTNAGFGGIGHHRVCGTGRCASGNGRFVQDGETCSASGAETGRGRSGDSVSGRAPGIVGFRIGSWILPVVRIECRDAIALPNAPDAAKLGGPPGHPDPDSSRCVCCLGILQGSPSPFFIIDSHPVDICRPIRAGKKQRLGGLGQHGYCASLKRWFYGVREHLIFTPGGRIAVVIQIPGNRHDSQGLYTLLETSFRGHLLGDNAYWPKMDKRKELAQRGILVSAATRSNWNVKNTPEEDVLLKRWRGTVERRIGLFDRQFRAHRTLCRSRRHYEARRWLKLISHNASRVINNQLGLSEESLAHFRLAA